MKEIIVDLFAGGGGASTGIEQALGVAVDIAINHDPEAIRMHWLNHPKTRHMTEDVWRVQPQSVVRGRRVGLLWASPDCTHHSRAKGNKPRENKRRCLADVVSNHWAPEVRPRVIMIENVPEFVEWGPVDKKGQPIKSKKGVFFREWVGKLRALGYVVEWRNLLACDYGAPTSRKRFFMIARNDRRPIVWPDPTHGPEGNLFGLKPYRTAAECIDWSIPCPSIFERKRPLAEATLRRIAKGLKKYVLDNPNPFIMKYYSGNRFGLVSAFLTKFYGTNIGSDMRQPVPTITATGQHIGEVRVFLVKYFGQGTGQGVNEPLHTITSRDRFGLVTVQGQKYQIADIGLRMLQPRELALAQGFPADYILTGTKSNQVAKIGNSVPPQVIRALVKANVELKQIKAVEPTGGHQWMTTTELQGPALPDMWYSAERLKTTVRVKRAKSREQTVRVKRAIRDEKTSQK
jgi:DNA (cytosine-5)-methyltransferase 1